MTEPTFRELVDWVDGRLDEERAATVTAYVATADAETNDAVAWLRDFKDAAGLLPLHSPPSETTDAARAVFRHLRAPAGADPRWFDVTFDSRLAPAAGIRSSTAAPTSVHLDLTGHGLTVSVDLTRVDGTHLAVDGSVRRVDAEPRSAPPAVAVVFARAGREELTVPVDRRGQFAGRAPADVDEMRVVVGAETIRASLTAQGDS